MLKKLLPYFFSWLISAITYAEPVPKYLHSKLWEQIADSKALKFNELTSDGEFAGCELTFRYPLRDYRQFGGEPILVTGSITNNYFRGKSFSLFLKIQPNKIEFNSISKGFELKTLTPASGSLVINNINLKKYELKRFKCSDEGLCLFYADSVDGLELLATTFNKFPFDASVLFSMSKTGIDHKFDVSDLSPADSERVQFTKCMGKSMDGLLEFLKSNQDIKK